MNTELPPVLQTNKKLKVELVIDLDSRALVQGGLGLGFKAQCHRINRMMGVCTRHMRGNSGKKKIGWLTLGSQLA